MHKIEHPKVGKYTYAIERGVCLDGKRLWERVGFITAPNLEYAIDFAAWFLNERFGVKHALLRQAPGLKPWPEDAQLPLEL